MKLSPLVLLAITLLTAMSTSQARADGLIRDGLGAISMGRGGTNIAFADNGAVLFDNAAGMMNLAGDGLADVSVDTLVTDLNYSNALNPDVRSSVRPFPVPMLSLMRKSDDGSWAYGFGFFAPAGFGTNYHMTNPVIGPAQYKSIGALAKLLPGVAYQVNDRLSIGGTFGLAFNYLELEGPYFLQSPPLTGVPTLLNLQSFGVAPTGSAGLQYKWSDRTMLGMNYTSQSRFGAGANVRADVFGLAPVPLSSSFQGKTSVVWPRSLGAGLKHNLCDCRRVSADVIWYNWSDAFDQFGLRLTHPSNPAFPNINEHFPMRWRDTVSYRLGYEQDLTEAFTWRCGYVYHNSPVPNTTLNPYLDGVLLHTFSLGASRRLESVTLNAAYQYSFSPVRHVGTSDIVGGDFSNSNFQAQAHWLSLGMTKAF